MPFDTRFCDGYLTIKPRKSQKGKTTSLRSSANNVHHVQNIFHKAVEDGDMTQVKVLLRYAQTNIHLGEPNRHGRTALQECCLKDNLEIIRLLLDHGASLEATDEYGWTALHYAAFFGSLDIVRFLVLSCADLMLENHNGETAYELAQNQDVKYYLHGMMMLGNGNAQDIGDTDIEEVDDDYYSDDKLSWRHESDNDSLGNSINCKNFDEIGPSDSRETVDMGYYGESLPTSPSYEGKPVKSFSIKQDMFECLEKNNYSVSSNSASVNEDVVLTAEEEQSLKLVDHCYCEEIDEESEYDYRKSVIHIDSVRDKKSECMTVEKKLAESKSYSMEMQEKNDRYSRESEEEIITDRKHVGACYESCKSKNIVKNCKDSEKVNADNTSSKEKFLESHEDRFRINDAIKIKKGVVIGNGEKLEYDEEKVKRIPNDENTKLVKVQERNTEVMNVQIKDCSSKISQGKRGKNITRKNEKKEVNENGKEERIKSRDKSRSRIPSAIPRIKKKTEIEKKEDTRKEKSVHSTFTTNVNNASKKNLVALENRERANGFEEKNKNGLERLWGRFRQLAARRRSDARNGRM